LTTDKKADKVKNLLKKEITALQSGHVPAQELEDVKTYLKGTFKASRETNAALSFTASLDELYGLGFANYRQYDEQINKVTQEDIRRLAGKYLNLNRSTVVVTRPKAAAQGQ